MGYGVLRELTFSLPKQELSQITSSFQ